MTIKELLIEADAIQVGVVESDWQRVIKLAARPLEAKGFISTEYSQAVIDNTLNHGAYYVFDEGIAIPHARPECGVRRNCFSLVLLEKPIPLRTVKKPTLSLCLAPGIAMRISRRGSAPSSRCWITMTRWPNCGWPAAGRRLSHYYEQTSDPSLQNGYFNQRHSGLGEEYHHPFAGGDLQPAGIDDRRHQRAVYGASGPGRPANESPAGLCGV